MTAASNYLERELLDHVLGTGSWSSPAAVYAALDTTVTTNADTGATITEPATANGYARQAIAFGAATGNSPATASNTLLESFGPNTNVDWGLIGDCCLTDNATRAAGNMLVYGPLTADRTVLVDDTFEFAIGSYIVSLS